jgi:hypothetical protein
MPAGVRISVAVAVIDALRCPKCSNGPDKLNLIPDQDFDGSVSVSMVPDPPGGDDADG